jgi:hypothetical protein
MPEVRQKVFNSMANLRRVMWMLVDRHKKKGECHPPAQNA